jgi:hypothetical protein
MADQLPIRTPDRPPSRGLDKSVDPAVLQMSQAAVSPAGSAGMLRGMAAG